MLKGAGRNLQKLVQDLTGRNLIRPLTTQGHVSDAVPNRVIHDAQTTSGGSGSPIFNSQGELIAVHSSIMTRFGAVGSGVPIARVVELFHSES
ncbi:MAG: trypsin-like peptidase domain-containing protein [Nitrospira sp.]|nr:trypsin-like peptidase domain-containing protein [Nitrospira sp.]